jgi:hypothetical protein
VSEQHEPEITDDPPPRPPKPRIEVAMGRAMMGMAELIEGKPPRDPEASQLVDEAGQDDGLKIEFDPDDPTATRVIIDP